MGAESDLDITLKAPDDGRVTESLIRSEGWALWTPDNRDSAHHLPAPTINYTAYGIRRHEDHSIGIEGKYASGGSGGKPPSFDVALADLEIVGHETTRSDGNGWAVSPAMVKGNFPDRYPGNISPNTITYSITPRWKGPPNPEWIGFIYATIVGKGVAVYDENAFLMAYTDANGKSIDAQYLRVPPAGYEGRKLKILTNENFAGSAEIKLTFRWYRALRGARALAPPASMHTTLSITCGSRLLLSRSAVSASAARAGSDCTRICTMAHPSLTHRAA